MIIIINNVFFEKVKFERVLTIVIEELTTLMINCYYVLVNLRNLYQHLYSTPLRLLLTNELTRLQNNTTP